MKRRWSGEGRAERGRRNSARKTSAAPARSSASSARRASARRRSARSHRRGDGPQVHPRRPRRRARRGRHPRPPPHLHRLHARPHHRRAAQGRHAQPGHDARRDRQARRRLPRRPRLRPARGARPGPEPHVHRPLPRRAVRPVEGAVHRDRQHDGPRARPAARPHGGHRDPRLHRDRQAQHRQELPRPAPARGQRPDAASRRSSRTTPCGGSSRATPARPACATSSATSAPSPARSPPTSSAARPSSVTVDRDYVTQDARPPPLRAGAGAAHQRARRRDRAWPTRRSAARSSSSRPPACPARATSRSPARSAT